MLIKKPQKVEYKQKFTEMQKMASTFLPEEQVRKFDGFQHLIEAELLSEAREPEIGNALKDLFDALHTHNIPKLLRVMQGDKKRLFFAFKKQLENKEKLTKQQARILSIISENEVSLLTISAMK